MKYIAYYRVSTAKQGNSGLGLDSQISIVESSLKKEDKLINHYVEVESGKKNDRIELKKALAECKKENATLIVAKLDRLSRSVSFISSLTDADIEFVACDFPNANKFTIHLFASVAQYERELISMRTINALQAKKEQAYKLGAPNAKFTPEMRNKAIKTIKTKAITNANNKRATCVINSLLKEDKNYSEIATYLNKNGFMTSRGCEFKAEQVKRLALKV